MRVLARMPAGLFGQRTLGCSFQAFMNCNDLLLCLPGQLVFTLAVFRLHGLSLKTSLPHTVLNVSRLDHRLTETTTTHRDPNSPPSRMENAVLLRQSQRQRIAALLFPFRSFTTKLLVNTLQRELKFKAPHCVSRLHKRSMQSRKYIHQ